MHEYVIIGTDVDTHAPVELRAKAASIPDAAAFASARGMVVQKVRTPEGVTFLEEGGAFRKEGETPPSVAQGSDVAIIAFSFLIPIVGFIAGAVRLARRDATGTRVLVAACAGASFWSFLTFALVTRR